MKYRILATVLLLAAVALSACGQLEGDVLTFKTASPGLTFHFRLLTPPIPPIDEPEVVPCEPVIKGNIASDGRKLFHAPGMPNYSQVKIDEAAGERTFCTEQEAIDAGWTKAGG